MELKDLLKMTVVKLREEAHKFEDMKGTLGMTKEQLIDVLCERYGIAKKQAPPKGIGRHALKTKIRTLRSQRHAVLAAGDRKAVRKYRRRMKSLRRHLRKVIAKSAHAQAPAKTEGAAPAS